MIVLPMSVNNDVWNCTACYATLGFRRGIVTIPVDKANPHFATLAHDRCGRRQSGRRWAVQRFFNGSNGDTSI